jgi:hypothetical protein
MRIKQNWLQGGYAKISKTNGARVKIICSGSFTDLEKDINGFLSTLTYEVHDLHISHDSGLGYMATVVYDSALPLGDEKD